MVVNYCLDMMQGDLERAETQAIQLKRFGPASLQAIDDFLGGRTLEPALDVIPVKVLQGFLKNLLGDLRGDE